MEIGSAAVFDAGDNRDDIPQYADPAQALQGLLLTRRTASCQPAYFSARTASAISGE